MQIHEWILERETVRTRKERGDPKPWSQNRTFQTTYFCNIHREDDRVTRSLAHNFREFGAEPSYIWNNVLWRLLNNQWVFNKLEFYEEFNSEIIISDLLEIEQYVPSLWGSAYIVSTNGRSMPKLPYVVENVVGAAAARQGALNVAAGSGVLATLHAALMRCNGLGSFMAAQVIADLKNTKDHPCYNAIDKLTFVASGPGSLRGLGWYLHNGPHPATQREFRRWFSTVHHDTLSRLGWELQDLDAQDFQNCLCEYDKYMRVSTGIGRSKRRYHAI